MIVHCKFCNYTLTCHKRNVLCEDCIESEFEQETGQLCSGKEHESLPDLIVCPTCQFLMILTRVSEGL